MTLINLPSELLIYKIVPCLPLQTIRIFGLVSKEALAIIQAAAKAPYTGRTLMNVEFNFSPGSFQKYLQFLQKSRVITRNPDLFVVIERARKNTSAAGKDANQVKSLVRVGSKNDLFGQPARALVVFDYESKHTKANGCNGLGMALCSAIAQSDEEMIEAVFLHPNVKNMNLHDYGIIDCLSQAIYRKNLQAVKKILSLPKAQTLKQDQIGQFMDQAIKSDDPAMIKALFSLPNASKLPVINIYGLGEALLNAATTGNMELVRALIEHLNAPKIPAIYWNACIERLSDENKKTIIEEIVSILPDETVCQLQYVADLQSSSE